MYKVQTTKQVDKYISKNKRLRNLFNSWLPELSSDPYHANDGMLINQIHKGLQVYKKRLSKYRALFIIDDTNLVVEVFKIGSRGDIYKGK